MENALADMSGKGMSSIINNNLIVRLLYFSVALPLVILLLPIVFIILFNHLVMGKSVDLSSLLKKVFLIDFYNKMKKKREDKLDEEEYDEEEEDDDEYEYEDVYVTPIEKIDSKEIK
jgi:hypothetical protein